MMGGCYEGLQVGYYEDVVVNKTYQFNYIPVEVRSVYDPYTAWSETNYKHAEDNSVFLYVTYAGITFAFICFFLAICTRNKDSRSSDNEALR